MRPMDDFVNRGGLGELMACAQIGLEALRARQGEPTGRGRTIPLESETAPHVAPGVNTTNWWATTVRIQAAILDGEKAMREEAQARDLLEAATAPVVDAPDPDDLLALLLEELREDPGEIVDFGCLDLRLSQELGNKLLKAIGRGFEE